jgi:hypothetical protein
MVMLKELIFLGALRETVVCPLLFPCNKVQMLRATLQEYLTQIIIQIDQISLLSSTA